MNQVREARYLKIQPYKIKVQFQKFMRMETNPRLYWEANQEDQGVS